MSFYKLFFIYFCLISICASSKNPLSGNIEVENKPGYLVFIASPEISEELWINIYDFEESKLLKLNPQTDEIATLIKDSAIVSLSRNNYEKSYRISNVFYPGDSVFVGINEKQYPILTIINRPFNPIELNYKALLNKNFIGIDDFSTKILNVATLKPLLQEKIKTGNFLNPVESYAESKKFLDQLYKEKAISENFYIETSNYQFYSFLDGVVQSKNKSLIERHTRDLDLNDTTFIYKDYYVDFLYNFAIADVEPDFTKKHHFNYFVKCEEKYSGKVREVVLFHALAPMSSSENEFFYDAAHRFLNICKNPALSKFVEQEVNRRFEKARVSKTGSKIISSKQREFGSLNNVLESLDSKLYFLDFWASWCGPCLVEMPFSKELQKEFPDVSFLYLSIDTDYNKWVSSVRKNNFHPENSFLLVNGYDLELKNSFKIQTIPRYIILDSNGVVLNADAPKPSNPNLKLELDKLLRNLK